MWGIIVEERRDPALGFDSGPAAVTIYFRVWREKNNNNMQTDRIADRKTLKPRGRVCLRSPEHRARIQRGREGEK